MANFGHTDLRVLNPHEPIWQETRSAPGAEAIIRHARLAASWEEAVRGCSVVLGTSSFHQRPIEQAVVELPNLNRQLAAWPAEGPLGVIFGSERSGLSNTELARCQAIVRIPTRTEAPSMNLGQAVAVLLYELGRPGREEPVRPTSASARELESLIAALGSLGKAMEYPPGFEPAARVGRIRQALQKAVLPPLTVRFLLSYARWMLKKFKSIPSEHQGVRHA
jgi:TrmH family RNA methyltransferase